MIRFLNLFKGVSSGFFILKSKRLAFKRFYNQMKFEEEYPSLSRDFPLAISSELVNKAKSLRDISIEKFNNKQKGIRREIKNVFNALWKENKNDINKIYHLFSAISLKKWQWLKKEMPYFTKIHWPHKIMLIFPCLVSWGKSRNNLICMGIRPLFLLEQVNWPLLIHELIHVNTGKIRSNIIKGLNYKKDSDEIAVTLLTRKITRALNAHSNLKIIDQKLAVPFADLEIHNKQLERISNSSNSYENLILSIDVFLKNIEHKEYYKKFHN